MLQPRPNTFAQTILSLSFFACDKAADHTFRFANNPSGMRRRGRASASRTSRYTAARKIRINGTEISVELNNL